MNNSPTLDMQNMTREMQTIKMTVHRTNTP